MPEVQKQELGVRLRVARLQAALSLEYVGAQMRVSKQAVWAWERGKANLTAIQLANLAAIYGASADTLLFGRGSISADLLAAMTAARKPGEKSPR